MLNMIDGCFGIKNCIASRWRTLHRIHDPSWLLTMRDERHPGTIYFYSDAIGLGSNAACAMIMSLHNLGGVGGSAEARGCTLLAVGGVAQLLCAARSFRGERALSLKLPCILSWPLLPLAPLPPDMAPPLQAHPFHHRSHHRHRPPRST